MPAKRTASPATRIVWPAETTKSSAGMVDAMEGAGAPGYEELTDARR